MDNLLCDELWLSGSLDNTHEGDDHHASSNRRSAYENAEFEQVFALCLEKEISYMPEPSYAKHLHSNNLTFARFRAIQWFIKCRSRFNLSFGTVFYAANYLDRFISICQCNAWKYWMVELLSVACFSIATKFNETSTFSFHEIQNEGLDYSFQSNAVLRMELILLKALGWRLNSVTVYSIVDMLACNIDSLTPHLHEKLISRVTMLLLQATLDQKMLEFRQSIVGISALWCSLDQLCPPISDTFIVYNMKLLNQSQQDDLIKCHKIMETQASMGCGYHSYYPSSPTTVLLKDRCDSDDGYIHESISMSHAPDIINL